MTTKELQDLLDNVGNWAKDTKKAIDKKSDTDAQQIFNAAAQSTPIPALRDALPSIAPTAAFAAPVVEPKPDAIAFQDFMGNIAEAMVDAQSKLDDESAKYLSGLDGKPHVLPSIFRVPKVSAQMKFALEVEQGKKINLLFYSNSQSSNTRNEQGIDFEMVSVPAPPGTEKLLQAAGPLMDLVIDPAEHREIVEAIAAQDSSTKLQKIIEAAGNPQQAARIAAVSFAAKAGTDRRYLIFYATSESTNAVGIWMLTIPATGKPALVAVYSFKKNNGEDEVVLRDMMLEMGDRLQSLFA